MTEALATVVPDTGDTCNYLAANDRPLHAQCIYMHEAINSIGCNVNRAKHSLSFNIHNSTHNTKLSLSCLDYLHVCTDHMAVFSHKKTMSNMKLQACREVNSLHMHSKAVQEKSSVMGASLTCTLHVMYMYMYLGSAAVSVIKLRVAVSVLSSRSLEVCISCAGP